MGNEVERGVEFVDSLLHVLGVGSVTTEAIADHDGDVEDGLRTGFYGKSLFSTKNRDMLQAVLQASPDLETLDELRQALATAVAGAGNEAASSVLQAVERLCKQRGTTRLDELVRQM